MVQNISPTPGDPGDSEGVVPGGGGEGDKRRNSDHGMSTPDSPSCVFKRFQTKDKRIRTNLKRFQTKSNILKRWKMESPLNALIKKKKETFEGASLMRLIRRDFATVEEARGIGASWAEIAEAYGFEGKEARARYAFFYERRRREKKGIKPDIRKEGTETESEKKIPDKAELRDLPARKKEPPSPPQAPEKQGKSKYRSHFDLPEDTEL